jgi:hypothetical protein
VIRHKGIVNSLLIRIIFKLPFGLYTTINYIDPEEAFVGLLSSVVRAAAFASRMCINISLYSGGIVKRGHNLRLFWLGHPPLESGSPLSRNGIELVGIY